MARINLLPWREEYRQQKKQEFFTHLFIVVAIAAAVAGLWLFIMNQAIDNQESRNNRLNSEIKFLSDQVAEIKELKEKRRQLLERMRIIQELQGTRPVIVRYFDEFAVAIPDGVFVTSLSRESNLLTIIGVTESNNRVSQFMRNLADSTYFKEPNLLDVDAAPAEGEQYSRFTMQLVLTAPGEDEDDK